MINLAPNHKSGLWLNNPLMIASGFVGYGRHSLLDLSQFGALVTNPITLRPERGTAPPRLAETSGGVILNIGQQNPGVKKVIQQHQKTWSRLEQPLIAHLPADEPDDLARTARALAGLKTTQQEPLIAAIELGLPEGVDSAESEQRLRAVRSDCDLPLLLKLPFQVAEAVIEQAVQQAVDALVVSAPPIATAVSPSGEPVTGHLYGGGVHGLILRELEFVRGLADLPLIAVGGVHSPMDVEAYLSAGATAVQLDSILFLQPEVVERWSPTFVSQSCKK